MCTASKAQDVHIVLEASLSRRGQQDALCQGVPPTDRILYRIDPGHPLWLRAVALEPEIDGSYVCLRLRRRWHISVVNETYSMESLGSESVFGFAVWRSPDAEIEWGEPQPLDEWLTIDRLVEMEEKNRAAAQRALAEMQHELDQDVRPSWRAWMSDFVDECRKRYTQWMGWEETSGPLKPSGRESLAAFRRAFEAFDAHTHDAAERADRLYSAFHRADKEMHAVAQWIEAARRRQELVAEATAWTSDHGSPRLHKALAADLIGSSLGVYRHERLALEHPHWSWLDAELASALEDIADPSESALDALLAARDWDPGAQLKWLTTALGGVPVVVATFLDRRAYLPVHPETAVPATSASGA